MKKLVRGAALLAICACRLSAQHYQVLHSFIGYPNDASYVVSSLVFDQQGNLYGTSAGGGSGTGPQCAGTGCGTVFELSPNGDGTWAERLLYSFCTAYDGGNCTDGIASYGGLALDALGNLYGATVAGGSQSAPPCGDVGCGIAFELSPPAQPSGPWTESVLHNFCSAISGGKCLDGDQPNGQLIFDSAGNLYGTAYGGSGHAPMDSGGGVVFELSPKLGAWDESVLYNFCSLGRGEICPDGDAPYQAGVTFGPSGNLYGMTEAGGNTKNDGGGVIYELSPSSGAWNETVLASFPSPTFGAPSGGVSLDPTGNVYGSFEFPHGGVFRLEVESGRKSVFDFNGSDGQQPIGGVTLDLKRDILYGTASGNGSGLGAIYEIDAQGQETILYEFCSQPNCADGYLPWATLIMDKSGNLYGTTEFGGEYGQGVVFELTP